MNVKLTDEEIEKVISVTADACHTVLQERYVIVVLFGDQDQVCVVIILGLLCLVLMIGWMTLCPFQKYSSHKGHV